MASIRSILAAVDLGDTTRTVLRTAETLTQATNAQLHVVHAIELEGILAGTRSFKALTASAERKLARAVARNLHEVAPASLEAVIYARHRTIADRARQVNADLMVLGPHRHGRAALGTTADRLLRTADCPCWIAQDPLRLPLKCIVVATDFSEVADHALDEAADITRALGGAGPSVEVVLLHVLHPDVSRTLANKCQRTLEEQGALWIEEHELAARARLRVSIRRVRHAANGILGYLRKRNADLLIMGTHGHGMIDRMLLGSVTARVLRDLPCDALAVPPQTRP